MSEFQTLLNQLFAQNPVGQLTGTVDVTLPQVPVRASPVIESHGAGVEIRLYDATTGTRKRLPSYQIGDELRWTIEPNGGYSDFAVTLLFSSASVDTPLVDDNDCLEIWNFGVRQFRGYASDIKWSEGEPGTLTVAGYGRVLDLLRMLMPGAYQRPQPVDVSDIFAEMGSDIVRRYPDIVIDAPLIGVKAQTFDTRLQNAKQALDSVYSFCAGVAVWGFDVDPNTNADRLYLRPINTSASPDFTIVLPGRNVGVREIARKAADVVNCVTIEGDPPDFPQLLPNGSGEALVRPSSADGGNLVVNPSFEVNSLPDPFDHNDYVDDWTKTAGAKWIQGGQGGKPNARTGSWFGELDTLGEAFYYTNDAPAIPLVVGHNYEIGLYALPEPGVNYITSPPVVTILFTWRSGGTNMPGQAITWTVKANEGLYQQTYRTIACPAGATGFLIQISLTGGTFAGLGTDGVAIDDVYVVDITSLKWQYWSMTSRGSARLLALNYQAKGAFDGRNCLYFNCTSSDVDFQDVLLAIAPHYVFDIVGGETYRFSIRRKSGSDGTTATTFPKTLLLLDCLDDAGNVVSLPGVAPIAASVDADWTKYSYDFAAPAGAVKGNAEIAIRGSGEGYLDALSVRCITVDPAFSDEDPTNTTYLPAGNLLATFRADIEYSAADNAAVNGSVSRYGLREYLLRAPGIKTITDARALARNFFLTSAIADNQPVIDVYDDGRAWWIGAAVQLTGSGASLYSSVPLPLRRMNGAIAADTGLQTLKLEIGRTKPTTEELIAALAKTNVETAVSAAVGAASSSIPTPGGSLQTFSSGLSDAGEWSAGSGYNEGAVVTRLGGVYVSLVDSNVGNDPLTDMTHTYWRVWIPATKGIDDGSV